MRNRRYIHTIEGAFQVPSRWSHSVGQGGAGVGCEGDGEERKTDIQPRKTRNHPSSLDCVRVQAFLLSGGGGRGGDICFRALLFVFSECAVPVFAVCVCGRWNTAHHVFVLLRFFVPLRFLFRRPFVRLQSTFGVRGGCRQPKAFFAQVRECCVLFST